MPPTSLDDVGAGDGSDTGVFGDAVGVDGAVVAGGLEGAGIGAAGVSVGICSEMLEGVDVRVMNGTMAS